MKILDCGKHWIRLDETDSRLKKLRKLLPEVENWIGRYDPRVLTAQYWGITKDSPEETCVVNLGSESGYEGEELEVTYEDVMRQFPNLKELFGELGLQPYLGTNKIGNWGIHRHCYNPTARWNLVMLGEGNVGSRGNFFEYVGDHPVDPDYDLVYGVLDECEEEEARRVETVYLSDGEAYSIDTWQWHSHLTGSGEQWHPTRAWLMHFKYAPDRKGIESVLRSLRRSRSARMLWRLVQNYRYRDGTHKL
jgi:hypothetical protein